MLTFPRRPPAHARRPAPSGRPPRLWVLPGIRLTAVGATIGARIGSTICGFGAGLIAARELGPHGRAQLAVLVAVPAVFSVVGVLGLDTANARFAGRSHSAFRQLVGWAVIFSAVAGSAMAAAWWFAGSVWPAVLLGLSPRLALLGAAMAPILLLMTLLGAAEIGRGRITVYNLVATGTTAAYLVAVLLLLAAGRVTVVGCCAAFAASQLLGVVALLILSTNRVHPDGERVAVRRYGGYALRAYLPNLAQYGMLRMDVPVIQVLAGTTAVALYAVALPAAECLLLLPSAVALVIFPRVTSGALDRAAADRIGRAVFAATVVLAGAAALAAPALIPAVYGAPYRGSVLVVWCMLPGLIAFSGSRTPQAYLAATDKLGRVIVATVAGVVTGLVSLLVLTPRYGAAGAGAADSVGYIAFAVTLLGLLRRDGPLTRLAARALRSGRERSSQAIAAFLAIAASIRPVAAAGCVALALATALLSASGLVTVSMLGGTLILLVLLAVPNAGIYLLAVAIPVSQATFAANLIPSKALIAVLITGVVGQAAAGRLTHPGTRMAALAAALVCYFLISATVVGASGAPSHDWRDVLVLATPLLCLPLSAGPRTATRRALVIMSFSAACMAVVEIFTAHASLLEQGASSPVFTAAVVAGRTGAVDHNTEGALFVLALAVLLARYPAARGGVARLTLAAGIAVLALGVAFSFSRSAYFGALAMVAAFAVRRSLRGLLGTAAGIGCLLLILPTAVTARISTVWSSSGLDSSSSLRLDLWASALRMIDAHPILGVGYLNFAAQLPVYYTDGGGYDVSVVQFSSLEFAHNTYLTVLAEFGLVGALLVGALIVAGWRRTWSAMRSGDWAGEAGLLAFVGVGVCSGFGEPLFIPAFFAAFLLVILAAEPGRREPRDRTARDPGAVRSG